jgi:branched-chain amino acid transport system substrate-binding protein
MVLMLLLSLVLAACGNTGGTQGGGTTNPTATTGGSGGGQPTGLPGVLATTTSSPNTVTNGATPGATTTATGTGTTPGATTTTGTGTTGAASNCPNKGENLLIYSSLPMTGGSANQIASVINGMKLALQQRGGKAGGYTINYKPLDDATPAKGSWDEGQETANANQAIRDKATVYLGTFNSGAATVSIPILNEAGIPMISPANTAINLTLPGQPDPKLYQSLYRKGPRNYFRVVPNDALQGTALANYAKALGVKKAYILHDQQTYGLGLAQVFRRQAEALGIEVAGFEGIDPKAGSYSGVAQKVQNSGADLLFFGGLDATGGPQLVKDLRSLEPVPEAIRFMGGDGLQSSDFVKGAGEEGEGTYATVAFGDPSTFEGKAKQFFEDYKATYNEDPDPYAIFGYDSMGVALTAIDRACSKDPKAVLQQLNKLGQYDGALGKFSFDKNGDTTLTAYYGWIVKDGKYTFDRQLSTKLEK